MRDQSLSSDEKRLVRTAFNRYHADIQIDNDARMNWLGFLIYVATLRPVLSMPPPHGGGFVACQVVILGGLTLVPFFLKIHRREMLLKWRDQVFMVHWMLHHVLGSRILTAAGVDFRKTLVSTWPPLLLIFFWMSRPTLWFCGNMVTYRMKFKLFLFFQPIVLALNWYDERRSCFDSATEYPEATKVAFGAIASALRGLTPSFDVPRYDDAMSLCCKVDAFFVAMVAYIIPGSVTWFLEQKTWAEFTRVDPWRLTWAGGPTEEQIAVIQKKMRSEGRARADFYYSAYTGRIIPIAFVIAITFWQFVDAPTPFNFVKSSINPQLYS